MFFPFIFIGLLLASRIKAVRRFIKLPVVGLLGMAIAGLGVGFLLGTPDTFVQFVRFIFPLLLIAAVVVVTIAIKRGLQNSHRGVLLAVVGLGVGYHVARENYTQGIVLVLVFLTALMAAMLLQRAKEKHKDSRYIKALRGSRLTHWLHTEI